MPLRSKLRSEANLQRILSVTLLLCSTYGAQRLCSQSISHRALGCRTVWLQVCKEHGDQCRVGSATATRLSEQAVMQSVVMVKTSFICKYTPNPQYSKPYIVQKSFMQSVQCSAVQWKLKGWRLCETCSTDLKLIQFRRKALGLRHTSPLVTQSCHCWQTSIACCAVCAGSLATTAWNRSPTIALHAASQHCAVSSCFAEALCRSGNKLIWREAGRVPD